MAWTLFGIVRGAAALGVVSRAMQAVSARRAPPLDA